MIKKSRKKLKNRKILNWQISLRVILKYQFVVKLQTANLKKTSLAIYFIYNNSIFIIQNLYRLIYL